MKVYKEIQIDISSGQVLYEDSYTYDGPVSLAKGGGGGGGGSGEVDYPEYMKEVQADWLGGGDPGYFGGAMAELSEGNSITELMDAAIGNSPYATASAYDPTTPLNNMGTVLNDYSACSHGVAYLDARQRLDDAIRTNDNFDDSTPYADTQAEITDYENYLAGIKTTDKIENELAGFSAGMSNINAVNSSSFTIGHQIIAGSLIETKIQAHSDLVSKRQAVADGEVKKMAQVSQNALSIAQVASQQDVKRGQLESDMATKLLHYSIERNRMIIAAKVEEANKNLQIDKNDALWDMEVFRTGGNVLASIGGGTVSKEAAGEEMSDGQAALSGAMSGAAMGASVGGGWGAAIGAVVGGVGGALMN